MEFVAQSLLQRVAVLVLSLAVTLTPLQGHPMALFSELRAEDVSSCNAIRTIYNSYVETIRAEGGIMAQT